MEEILRIDAKGNRVAGAFDRYGMRVPLIVVSPWARPHFVAHETYDHTSITRFVEARFLIPALPFIAPPLSALPHHDGCTHLPCLSSGDC